MKCAKALVREPGERYTTCISTHPLHHTVSLEKARIQHDEYCSTLKELGLEVIYLKRDDGLPDSCFVEDNAVVHKGKALISRMAEKSRRGEEKKVAEILNEYMPTRKVLAPATIEGGDVIQHEDGLIVAFSQRTNQAGIDQMSRWFDSPVKIVDSPEIMHLKSHVTYLGKGIMLATETFAYNPALEGFHILSPPKEEEYATNALTIGDNILMAAGCPNSHRMVKDAGFEVISLDLSEIKKCDGALTCLSILF